MEAKHNESTELRPEGGRLMDAPVVPMNVPEFIRQIKDEPAWKKSDRNAITIYKTNGMRIVLIALHEDAVMEKHTTNGIVSVQVLDGEVTFNTEANSIVLRKGEMIAMHRNVPHSVAATKESVFLLTVADFLG
ncbi:MAG TPA: cupin domain-containing protein [Hanamia sp.]|jgi:quercetin dioxygenase-like cupin family protein|nr:cupin domain-containing protein [Hanamia sp.]